MIEINGKQYEERPKKASPKMSSFMAATILLAGGMSGLYREDKGFSNIDIVKEFGLIQQKKSNLSKQKRDWVIYQFNKNFIEL